jgi:hypothetical protein
MLSSKTNQKSVKVTFYLSEKCREGLEVALWEMRKKFPRPKYTRSRLIEEAIMSYIAEKKK